MDAIHQQPQGISKEQSTASKKILNYFANTFRWVILLAQMQSGKSDAYLLVAAELFRLKKIKNVVILSGFQDTELKQQMKDLDSFKRSYRRYMEQELGVGIDDREYFEDTFYKQLSFVCGADLEKNQMNQSKNTLFIWDESHYAQNRKNRPYKFLQKMHISADGNHLNLEGARNNYFLSVSATPYSEISDIVHEKQQKKIVKMMPGQGYISVGMFFRNNCIIPVENWEETLFNCFLERNVDAAGANAAGARDGAKYAIVRILGDDKMTKAVQLAKDAGWAYEIYDGEQKAITKKEKRKEKMQSLEDLGVAPLRNKVIFIRGMLRMGKRVNKTHIAFVMETSKNSNTDVLLQGLLGRMCGYHTNQNIKIYVGEKLLKKKGDDMSEVERYIALMETRRGEDDDEDEEIKIMPRKASNLGALKNTTENDWFTALPIVINPLDKDNDNADPNYICDDKDLLIQAIKAALIRGGVENHNGLEKTEELKEQVLTTPAEDWVLRKITKSNGAINETYKDVPKVTKDTLLSDNNKKAISDMPGCGFSTIEKPLLNIWLYNSAGHGYPAGTIVLHGRTKRASEAELKQAEIERSIPITTKLEAFTSKHEDETVVIGNGAYSIHAPVETSSEPDVMQKYLANMITISRMEFEAQTMPRCITSNQLEGNKWQGIIVNELVFKAIEKNGNVYNYIKDNFGLNLKITKTRGKVPDYIRDMNLIRLAKIEW